FGSKQAIPLYFQLLHSKSLQFLLPVLSSFLCSLPSNKKRMILSALLTSVVINLGLCFLFFTLYSVLRKQPWNSVVYAPRLVDKQRRRRSGKAAAGEVDGDDFNLDMLLPSAGWVRCAWQLSEDDLLSRSGLDAVVFMRIFVFSSRVFAIGGAIGIFILLPINYLGNQLSIDFYDLPNKTLESFSISNVNDGSNWLWVHFSAAYIFTGVVCYLLYNEYDYISLKRIDWFYLCAPQPHQFTIVVRGIPSLSERSFSETVQMFFTENHPTTYLSHRVVHQTSKIRELIKDAEKLYRRLARVKSQSSRRKDRRDRFMGFVRNKDNTLNQYEKKLEDMERSVRTHQHSFDGEEVPVAFVSFKSRLGAAAALLIQQGIDPTEWLTEEAPEPRDIHWSSFSSSFMKRWISKIVVGGSCVALTILFLIPVFIVQGLANLEQLETWFPFLKSILDLTIVSQVITGYFPSLILTLFLFLVPPIMLMLSSMEGHLSSSSIEKSTCTKVLWFTIWNIFFANVLSGSALSQLHLFLEPKNIPKVLAEAVPGQATFFISYVLTSGWTSVSSEVFRVFPLLLSYVNRLFSGNVEDEELEVPKFPYYSEMPRILFFGLLGTTYFFLAPLILPFILVYFCMGYIIFRNQLLNVYEAKYETNGRFWPTVHNATIFSLILMHIIAIGIFGVKKVPIASTLTLPLPILTLLFNEYCRRRFLPLFRCYPTESMMKKDKEDLNQHNMNEFYDKLITAYRDPALMPVQYVRDNDRLTSPLLQTQV
ncbi:CSC1-like protein HYP1, partial [Linum perenne]